MRNIINLNADWLFKKDTTDVKRMTAKPSISPILGMRKMVWMAVTTISVALVFTRRY